MSQTKAVRATILLGSIPLNVYQLPCGKYVLSGRNVTDAIKVSNKSLSQKMGVKSLKDLPGADLTLSNIKAETGEGFIAVSIPDAVRYWSIMAKAGNDKAWDILEASAIEAIERRADAAFGKEVSEEERNNWFKIRTEGKQRRREYTDSLMNYYLLKTGAKPDWTIYAILTAKLNTYLGIEVRPGIDTRDALETKLLSDIDYAERCMSEMIDCGLEPSQALDMFVERQELRKQKKKLAFA